MSDPIQVVWFRQDLRLTDHRALRAAIATGAPVLPVYILDDQTPGSWPIASASRWWLHHSLEELTRTLADAGAPLILRRGTFAAELVKLVKETKASAVFCSRSYEPWAVALEKELKPKLEAAGAELKRYPGSLLREPEHLRTKTGGPFKVYTPFWNALSGGEDPAKPQPAPTQITPPSAIPKSDTLASWKLLPTRPDWAGGMRESWQPGEAGATLRLEAFLNDTVSGYADGRNRPDKFGTSRLSPHLHFGEISPNRVWHAVLHHARGSSLGKGAEIYLKELVWREFSHHLLFHFSDLPDKPFRPEFAAYPWKYQKAKLTAWQRGCTGFPIVDAGMRELWHTGWMHNRVRMIVASFLIKHLADLLAAGRSLVLGDTGRCRPRKQRRELAMGGRIRRRRRPLFSHLQPDEAGRHVRSRRQIRSPMGARTGGPAQRGSPCTVAGGSGNFGRGPASRSAKPIRIPSSSTKRPGRPRLLAMRRYGTHTEQNGASIRAASEPRPLQNIATKPAH